MKQYFLLFFFFWIAISQLPLQGQPFTCGSQIPAPSFSSNQQQLLDSQLLMSKISFEQNPQDANRHIWYARRLGYLARYNQAIELLTRGIALYPYDARMYRHRGHRYLTIRCIDKAIDDFEEAARLVKGKPDQVEPDGQPNSANIPTSTLQSNIYYHLGLAFYLKKNYAKAKEAYEKCLQVSANPDMYTATANWYYLTLKRMNSNKEAELFLERLDFETPLLENEVYRKILQLHKSKLTPEEAFATAKNGTDVQSATYLYGLYIYFKLNNHLAEAEQVKQQLLAGKQYASFGYIAAEVE
jgi:tetratricopeptide (TPR) repeat protein